MKSVLNTQITELGRAEQQKRVTSQDGSRITFIYSLVIPILLTLCIIIMGTALGRMEGTVNTTPFTLFELSCSGSSCNVILLNTEYVIEHTPIEGIQAQVAKWTPVIPPFIRLLVQSGNAVSDGVMLGLVELLG